ncbi:hypothetical protein DY000_02008383 [Brassica cretica]|uniref:Uncharacterized protein n=1 Tax=Brassica cretica TaxID=69181 RepID=A0ABQ7CKH9_BRACR|nr:hypothetical protein DY000_02008383 [Brassica cretica]
MYPPDLNMLETNSGLRGSDRSFSGISTSQIVVMAGRWIMYDNGAWDFKIDNDRIGRAVDCYSIKGVCGLKDSILAAYGLLGREIEVEMCYWLIDGDSEMVGKGAAPVEIATDTDYKIFKALHRTYIFFNVFVTFTEIVGGEMIFLSSERDIFTQTNATAVIVDDDENLIRQVEAIEAAIGLNFEAAEVGGSKDSRAAADGVCGANVEAASGDDIGNVAGCAVMDVDKRKDEDDDFEGCPPKGRRGRWSDQNGYERPGWRGGRGQGYGKPASGRGQRSRATEIDISLVVDVVHATPAKDMNQPNHRDNSVYRRLSESTSGTVRCALTFETATVETVDVAAVTPPQQKKKHNRVIEDDDEFVDPPLRETAKVCNSTRASDEIHSADSAVNVLVSPQKQCKNKTVEKDTWESDDAVLVTPPKQYTKHNRVIEADDEFVDPPLTETRKVCNSTSACDEKLSGDEKDTGESDDAVLVTPPKQYNKHNRVIKAGDDFVDPPVIQTTEFDGGEAFTPGKHIPSTYVFEDDDLFVDPPVTEVHVFNDMEGSGFQPQDIDYSKEDSDIYVGRMFKDKAHVQVDDADLCTRAGVQMFGLPFRNAIAASSYRSMEYNVFVSQYHVKDTCSETIKVVILPVPNPEDIHIPADILKLELFPPMTKRMKGRPDIKRKLSAREVPEGPRKKEEGE